MAFIGLTEGKEGRNSEPRTKAWSRVGDGDDNYVVFGERRHWRPELELELIQPHLAQKPVLRGEVGCACVGGDNWTGLLRQ